MSFVFSMVGLLIGLIVGFVVGVATSTIRIKDAIKEGALEIGGKVYRVSRWPLSD